MKALMSKKAWLVTLAFSVAAAAVTLLLSMRVAVKYEPFKATFRSYLPPPVPDINAVEAKRFHTKYEELDDLKAKLNALKTADSNTEVGAQVALIRDDMAALSSRMKTLEDGLLESPEKALALPLMRKDIERVKDSHRESVAAMANNIERVYDQNKWFIGLIGTMAVGMISLAVSTFIQMRQKSEH